MSKSIEEMVEGGAHMLKMVMDKKSEVEMWDQLGKLGFSAEERVTIAGNVKNFLNHKKGNHEKCPPNCGMTDKIAEDVRKLGRMPSIEEMGEMIESKRGEQKQYSETNLEEWK